MARSRALRQKSGGHCHSNSHPLSFNAKSTSIHRGKEKKKTPTLALWECDALLRRIHAAAKACQGHVHVLILIPVKVHWRILLRLAGDGFEGAE